MDLEDFAVDFDEIVFIVEEDKEQGGYSAVCQRHGIFTQGEDLDELIDELKL